MPFNLYAEQPKDWQLGFQKAASKSMEDIVWFHDYMLLPIITAITAFVLFLVIYACIRFRASRNPVASTTSHNTLIEIIWTLVPCLILIVMAVPSFKVLYSQDEIPPADVTIKAIGYQWYWGYEYPDENIEFDSYMIEDKDLQPGQPRLLSVDNEIFVPVNKVVKVLITANDVLHAWALLLLELNEMLYLAELMKLGSKQIEQELFTVNVQSYVVLNTHLCRLQ